MRAAARRPKSKIHLKMGTGEMIEGVSRLSTRMSGGGESLDPVRIHRSPLTRYLSGARCHLEHPEQ